MLMSGFDYDVVIMGPGFGGSVAALRAAEKGYRVGVMESGKRWPDEDIPKTPVGSAALHLACGGGAVRGAADRVPRRRPAQSAAILIFWRLFGDLGD